jgi:hypothetical protein
MESAMGKERGHFVLAIIVLVIAINFFTWPAQKYFGDADAVRVQTATLLNTGEWKVPQEIAESFGPRGQYFYQNANGNWYPKYGVLNTLIYAPVLWLEKVTTDSLVIDSPDCLLYLNLFNLVLSGATAFYLVLLGRRYTESKAIVAIFVLTSLYSTFWWNYLRAQTFEIYQTLFMLAFYYHFVAALGLYRSGEDRRRCDVQFLVAAIYFGALCLCKSVYVVLLPAIIAVLVGAEQKMSIHSTGAQDRFLPNGRKDRLLRTFLFFWLPIGVALCILAGTNWSRFDSPFATGYTQWTTESQLFKASNVFPALWGFVFSAQRSVFFCYPVLLFALAGWLMFFKKHRLDAIAAGVFGLSLLLINSAFTNWGGQASYGPRYLLPILPILGLPFIHYLTWLLGLSNKLTRSLLVTITAASLAYSVLLQICVNTMPFFFYYSVRDTLDDRHHSKPASYLRSRHFGTVNRDFLLFRFGSASPLTSEFINLLNASESERMNALNQSVRINYYWFANPENDGEIN